MKEFTVSHNDAGQRVDRFISKLLPGLPWSLLIKYIRLKRIKLNGQRTAPDMRLALGDTLQLYINDEYFDSRTKIVDYSSSSVEIKAIYEDSNIILIDKPVGLCVHDDERGSSDTLADRLKAYLFSKDEWDPSSENSFAPALCNRIDRNTSGIVIAAKNAEALRIMNSKIKSHEIEKSYLCIVHGTPQPAVGRISNYILKNENDSLVKVYDLPIPGAKEAITSYRTISSRGRLSLVECVLTTGRTHQIRAQFASKGWPLLGDGKYGRNELNKPYGEKMQALCSYKLRFRFSGEPTALDYLNKKTFTVATVPFAVKYFETDINGIQYRKDENHEK